MRITVPIKPEELSALSQIASDNCRSVREQARFILRCEAIARGLLRETEADKSNLRECTEATHESAS